jgi:7-cyano-7-deazaguanine synthase
MSAAALVLFSGGQDSTTCLAWALDRFDRVETIGFDYGQRHRIELECRNDIRSILGSMKHAWASRLSEDHTVGLGAFGEISSTALTRDVEIGMNANGLPNTFVPGRNLVFLTFAAAVAYRRGIRDIVAGMCETDYSGYPDCRNETIKAMERTLGLGMDCPFVIHAPLMWIDKAATWELAHQLGGQALLNTIITKTHTCYLGVRGSLHEWGHGCGECPACRLRAAGYERYRRTLAAAAE